MKLCEISIIICHVFQGFRPNTDWVLLVTFQFTAGDNTDWALLVTFQFTAGDITDWALLVRFQFTAGDTTDWVLLVTPKKYNVDTFRRWKGHFFSSLTFKFLLCSLCRRSF